MTTIVKLQNGQTETWAECYPIVHAFMGIWIVFIGQPNRLPSADLVKRYEWADVADVSFETTVTL